MYTVNFVLFRVLAVVGFGLSVFSLYRRDLSNGTYVTFMFVQCIAYAHTGWLICTLSVFMTLAALLLTGSEVK